MRSLTKETIGYISLFENLTNTRVKDCYLNKEIIFIVEKGDAGKAIGKDGAKIKRISKLLSKKIKIVEFNEDIEKFINALIYPIKGKIYKENSLIKVEIRGREKALVLGKNKQNLKLFQDIIFQHFKYKLIIV